jgi:anti-sigma regulatory factor (Ser/Thr protein kinase)
MDASMATPQRRSFEARPEQFREMRGHAERCCLEAGFERAVIDRLILVLEELFANTVEHGYSRLPGPPGGRLVWLTLKAAMGRIEVVYEDAAPEHDPFTRAAEPDYTGPADSWQVGGLGVALVIRLGRDVRYERTEGRNRIHFTISASLPGA